MDENTNAICGLVSSLEKGTLNSSSSANQPGTPFLRFVQGRVPLAAFARVEFLICC